MDAAAHIAELRQWHDLVADRMLGFGLFPTGFEPATYARWRDVGVLLQKIEQLERDAAVLAKAPTDVALAIPGGPCEPHYVKGWNDCARAAGPIVRTVFNRARIEGKDLVLTERWAIDSLATLRRTAGRPPAATDSTATVDPWEGAR